MVAVEPKDTLGGLDVDDGDGDGGGDGGGDGDGEGEGGRRRGGDSLFSIDLVLPIFFFAVATVAAATTVANTCNNFNSLARLQPSLNIVFYLI